MDNNQIQSQSEVRDDIYLEIWKVEQEFVKTRWTVITFFMSASFALLAFSFQGKLTLTQILASRISGLFIYWFAYLLYIHFYNYTRSLRAYLIDMEKTNRTTYDIQSKIGSGTKREPSTTKLLFLFGLIYMIGIVLLILLGL